jgi:hypothetical protein
MGCIISGESMEVSVLKLLTSVSVEMAEPEVVDDDDRPPEVVTEVRLESIL